jgi:[protein-PII] uridylyltransferase
MITAATSSPLRELYATASADIQQRFTANGDGREATLRRARLVEDLVLRLWNSLLPSESTSGRVALLAIGGFGRGFLFPFSDVDILFLWDDRSAEQTLKDATRRFSQELWDLGLKLSPATRTISECGSLDPQNVEFAISLLDGRFLAGDGPLFSRLRDKVLFKLVQSESQALVNGLDKLTRSRHVKAGGTIFQLEPNVKDTPGGLRDYHVASWLATISAVEKLHTWPDPKSLLTASSRRQCEPALDFLMAVRCFLHYRHGRDDNTLSWEAQDQAAVLRIGAPDAAELDSAAWMRLYFSHARVIQRAALQMLDETPAGSSSLARQIQSWRGRTSNSDFSVVDGLVFLQQPSALEDPEVLLRLFHFAAQQGVRLSATTEYRIEQVLPALASTPPRGAELWLYLGEILNQPHAADALRAMHSLRLLTILLPELSVMDALVIRDFYHRFTVDEHSFLAIEHLHRLPDSSAEWDKPFHEILGELEQPELLYLSLLLHDTGKGVPGNDHVVSSLDIAASCLQRLDLEPSERDTVLFLVASHLEMSAALRRDIFAPETAAALAEKVGTPERLKMLCLFTYADIKAVNPDALTPWKAENVWQLYIATANSLNRSADTRLHADADSERLSQLRTLAPIAGKKIKEFLEGLPQRYLRTYTTQDVLHHLEMAQQLARVPVQLALKRGRHWFELTLVTNDRPYLFATVAGALAAWGMNIVKASAFSNQAGTVVDTFYFTDRFRTLELNLSEWDRFKTSIADVLTGKADLQRMLNSRLQAESKNGGPKVKVSTRIDFDDDSSPHSTLVQVIAQDRPGLLHRIASSFSSHECSIDIALIDTEGHMAIDVFYLTSSGGKLAPPHQKTLAAELAKTLGE